LNKSIEYRHEGDSLEALEGMIVDNAFKPRGPLGVGDCHIAAAYGIAVRADEGMPGNLDPALGIN
jgi:hypothetical protein